MAPRRPQPLQLWVVGTLALVLSLASGALWWERQLPGRLRQALDSGDWSRCLELTEQLAALRWLGEGAPQQQARCRRQRAAQQRWWEALDSHNRLDHPWWRAQTQPQRQKVDVAIARIGDSQEHQQHSDGRSDVISGTELDRAVQQQLDRGLEPWQAFEAGCRALGGQVEEDGPESFCRRRGPTGA